MQREDWIDNEQQFKSFFFNRLRMSNITITSILSQRNVVRAYNRVVDNGGAAGIDEMSVEELGDYPKERIGAT